MPKQPTEQQKLAAKIRSKAEAYERKHQEPYLGGWRMPPKSQVLKYLSKLFNMPACELSFYFTYSRECTHPWNEGACVKCPVP
jgi:hypothetical protein